MKKIIAILFVMLIIPSVGYGGTKVLSKFIVPEGKYAIRVLCVDGYKFVSSNNVVTNVGWAGSQKGHAIGVGNSITQMFEERDGKSLPAKC